MRDGCDPVILTQAHNELLGAVTSLQKSHRKPVLSNLLLLSSKSPIATDAV